MRTPIIDADAHVMESPDLFTSRFPAKYAEIVPRVKIEPASGREMWYVGDLAVHWAIFSVIPGGKNDPIEHLEHKDAGGDGWSHYPKSLAEVHPASYDPNERVKVMDSFGIRSATTFPNLGILGPDIFRKVPGADLNLQMQIISVYNDWIMTWPEAQPGRFIPLAILPYWDVPGAVKEIERCAEMGMKGLVMTGRPELHGCPILPDPQWDPMWAAAQAAGLSVSFHAGAGGFENHYNDDRRRITGTPVMEIYSTVSMLFQNTISAVDLLVSGVLQRFPKLNFGIIETGMGWARFALEALDQHYKRYTPWLYRPEMRADELPSDLFKRQVYLNFWFEDLADQPAYLLKNVMFETDFPHPTSMLGNDIQHVLDTNLTTLTEDQKDDVLWRNALRFYNLTPSEVGL